MFSLGFHGRIAAKPKRKLTVDKSILAEIRIKDKRKSALLHYLSDMGLNFDGVDLSGAAELSKAGIVHITYEHNDFLPVGLKLLAEAQANIKNKPHEYEKTFMRCDFYPLASPKPVIQKVNISEFVGSQSPELQEWILKTDRLLIKNGCKVDTNLNRFRGSCTFDYISRKSKKKIYKVQIGISGCVISVTLADKELLDNKVSPASRQDIINILRALPDDLRTEYITNKTRGCGWCKKAFCGYSIDFEESGKIYNLCGYIRHNPTPEQFDMIERLIDARRKYISEMI